MLLNLNRHEFGKKQVTEEDVDDVELPPWALGNALLFTHRHREASETPIRISGCTNLAQALESDYVSRHLPSWIDLIFGHKQHDKDAFTCYHPLSYKNAIGESCSVCRDAALLMRTSKTLTRSTMKRRKLLQSASYTTVSRWNSVEFLTHPFRHAVGQTPYQVSFPRQGEYPRF